MDLTGFLAIAVIVVLAVVLLRASFTKVPREANWTVERLGRFNRVLTPGLHFVVPVEVADLQPALIQLVGTHMRDVIATRTISELATDRAAVLISGNSTSASSSPEIQNRWLWVKSAIRHNTATICNWVRVARWAMRSGKAWSVK